MEKKSPLEKRVKRRVTGRNHSFFIVVSPGLEKACLKEVKTLFPDKDGIDSVDGGIEFTGTVADCYSANLHLRTASRILMRIGSFTAIRFSELEKKLSEFPWELYLKKGAHSECVVTAKKSKLYHSGAIAERFQISIENCFKKEHLHDEGGKVENVTQQIFVRAVNDRFVISLDSSGELLYLRGIKTHGGKAPIRETLAAGILMLAGYDGKQVLCDPMCGAGTFSIEAAMIAEKIPPGWFRDFAFTQWPCFRAGTWKHIRREAEKRIIRADSPQIYASDEDKKICEALKISLKQAGFSHIIQVNQEEFFSLSLEKYTGKKGIVVINPPYGHRLGTKKSSEQLVNDMFREFETSYKGWKIAVISPFDAFMKKSSQKLKKHSISHGGLTLKLITGRIRD